MNKKKKYRKPELKVIELSFNVTQLGDCNTPTVTFENQGGPLTCVVTGCMTP